MLMVLAGMTACSNENEDNPGSGNDSAMESLYGEWWLAGWNDGGTWFEVDTNYVSHQHLSIEFREIEEDIYFFAWSMVNEMYIGKLLTVNGNELILDKEGAGSTMVLGDIKENLFFEKYICDIKSYQLEGNQLRLYYTDNDYFVFTKDFDDREGRYYEWKDGPKDPFIGEVTAMSDGEVEVIIIHSPSYVIFYSRTVPPMGNREICRFAASDFAGLAFETGDKVAFRIVQFKGMKVEKGREYQLKVEPCKGSEHITSRTGTMHNDQRMGWIIIDDEVNERQGDIYYYPLKVLAEEYLTEGLPVKFSGELYPTWKTPWDNQGHSDCYYIDIDAVESIHKPMLVEGRTWAWGSHPAISDELRFTEYFSGDTLIGGVMYKKLFRHFIWNERIEYVCAFRENERKVFCVENGQSGESIIYDFNLEKGDKLGFPNNETIVVDAVSYEDGRRILSFTLYTLSEAIRSHWIEGIGCTQVGLSKSHHLGADGAAILLYCEENGKKIWERNLGTLGQVPKPSLGI